MPDLATIYRPSFMPLRWPGLTVLLGKLVLTKNVCGEEEQHKYSHDMISDMVFDRPSPFEPKFNSDKSNEKAATDKPTPIQQFINHSDLQEFVSNSAVKDIWECRGTMLYKMLHAPEESRCPADEIPHQEHTLDSANPILMPLSCN
ncbi:hypothetical protein ACJMK2_032831 [Sinanodonta woodiana]|uniref:Uncharacterized protein n=1 Tax=Sinanodonta woodiana TaxID=1069815 RepID=A0ABD3X3I4_SINWO